MAYSELYPDFFARFYDIIYKDIRSDDLQYFMNYIIAADGPVLDVGVGTGRFFLEALKNGADIYGIDISPAMVEVLNSKLTPEEQGRVEVVDICNYENEKKFKLIVAPFRVFSHLLSHEQQMAALQAFYRLLLPGGILLFDLFVPNLKMLHEGLDKVLDFDGEYAPGKKLRRYTSMRADPVLQFSYITFRLEWEEHGEWKQQYWETKIRFFFYHELLHLLERSPFLKYEIFGDIHEQDLNADSKEFFIKCRV